MIKIIVEGNVYGAGIEPIGVQKSEFIINEDATAAEAVEVFVEALKADTYANISIQKALKEMAEYLEV